MPAPRRTALVRMRLALLGAALLAGCAASPPPEPAPWAGAEPLEPPPNQVDLRLYVIGWRQDIANTLEPAPVGFRVENGRLVASDRLETAAGAPFTPDELNAWADSLSQAGSAALFMAPAFLTAPGNPVGMRDMQEIPYLSAWRFTPSHNAPEYQTLAPGVQVQLCPKTFPGSEAVLVQADIRSSAAQIDKFLVADEFSNASPALVADLPRLRMRNVSGSVLLPDGGSAVLAHLVQQQRPDSDRPLVREHLFYIVSARKTTPGPAPPPEVDRIAELLNRVPPPETAPEKMFRVAFRWDERPGSESESSPGMEATTDAEIAASLAAGADDPAAVSGWAGVSVAPDGKGSIQFGEERGWPAGIVADAGGKAPGRRLDARKTFEGLLVGLAAADGENPGLHLTGILGGTIRLETVGEVLPALRPDAAPSDVEKYFHQRLIQGAANIGLQLPLTADGPWRVTPPWRPADPSSHMPQTVRFFHLALEELPVPDGVSPGSPSGTSP